MFISSKEKETLTLRITILEDQMLRVSRILNTMHDEKHKLSEEDLKKRTAYARAYYQRKKAEKLAQEQKA